MRENKKMNFLKQIEQQAKLIDATIVLPEANIDERVKKAGEYILKHNLSKLIVLGKQAEFPLSFAKNKNCTIIDIEKYNKTIKFAEKLFELRKEKGITIEEANKLIKNPIYFATMLVKMGCADGLVAGAHFSTSDILRPALQIIKTKPNKQVATGSMLLIKKNCPPILFGDVSMVEKPDAETLAQIAISNAEFYKKCIDEPRVAMLSYSTKGSAKSEMVELVQTATRLAKKSKFKIDGEMQLDSAVDAQTAKRKGVSMEVGGRANVFIFPDLNAGNIGYKLVSRFGGYTAIGPLIFNMKKPISDLSRGCTVNEIVATVILTKLQAKN